MKVILSEKMKPIIEFENIVLKYNQKIAIKDFSSTIVRGKKVALLGANGAGKTSIMKMASGLILPTRGKVFINSVHSPKSIEAKKIFSYLPQQLSFPKNLKAKEIIKFVAANFSKDISREIINELQFDSLLNNTPRQMSGGERRKLGIICTFLGNPELVILDEPTANIDIQGRALIEDFLKNYFSNKEKTLLFSSHQMREVDNLAEEIIILNKGQSVEEGPTNKVKSKYAAYKVKFKGPAGLSFKSIISDKYENETYEILTNNSDALLRQIFEHNTNVQDIRIEEPKLDEILFGIWGEA